MINRSPTTKPMPLNIVGSSKFGVYPKISVERSYNFFESDGWVVPYAGYQLAIPNLGNIGNLFPQGRGIFNSTKFGKLVVVVDNNVYLCNLQFNQQTMKNEFITTTRIGLLETSTGVVYITENNRPQIVISDNVHIYVYDPTETPIFQVARNDLDLPLTFTPGYITFHDTYIIAAASNDRYPSSPNIVNNTWRLSQSNNALIFPDQPQNVGLISTKPDNTQAVVRFPSKGNMIFVMGSIVTEPWFDIGFQIFPYQRNSSFNIDFGCLSPATVAYMDEFVAWLGGNEESGPVIMVSNGGMAKKITTDGIDRLFANFQDPSDSRGFLYRQDGHVFYHINFYTDNMSFFYDFNTDKIYDACDENLNYFIADQVAFFNNQYYFITRNNGNVYAFDTIFTTYDGKEIPRFRICNNIRLPSQEYFIANDVGFTIEQGIVPYDQSQNGGPLFLITQDCKFLVTQASNILDFITQDGQLLVTQNDMQLIAQQVELSDDFAYLIAQQPAPITTNGYPGIAPRVDMAISIDGGYIFGNYQAYYLNPLGHRKNKLLWWNLGAANDLVCQFKFWGLGRFTATDGVVNIRQ
jgi:hypothetical protein